MAPFGQEDASYIRAKMEKMSVDELRDVLAQKDDLLAALKEERDALSRKTDISDRIQVLEEVLTTLPKGGQLKTKAQMLKDVQQSIHEQHQEIVQKHKEEVNSKADKDATSGHPTLNASQGYETTEQYVGHMVHTYSIAGGSLAETSFTDQTPAHGAAVAPPGKQKTIWDLLAS